VLVKGGDTGGKEMRKGEKPKVKRGGKKMIGTLQKGGRWILGGCGERGWASLEGRG